MLLDKTGEREKERASHCAASFVDALKPHRCLILISKSWKSCKQVLWLKLAQEGWHYFLEVSRFQDFSENSPKG
jgi:hypothetical protein